MTRFTRLYRQKGLTLVELALVTLGLAIISGLGYIGFDFINEIESEAEERNIYAIISKFYADNIKESSLVHSTPPSAGAHLTTTEIAQLALARNELLLQRVKLEATEGGADGHFSKCSVTNVHQNPLTYNTNTASGTTEDLHFCAIVAYITTDHAPLATLPATTADWGSHVKVDRFVIFEGQTVIESKHKEAREKLRQVAEAYKDYYARTQSISRLGNAVNHFANESKDGTKDFLFNPRSVFRNTEANTTDDHLFTSAERVVLGLPDDAFTTDFGEIMLDNGSTNVRSPDNGNTNPYSARVFLYLTNDNSVVMSRAVVSNTE